MDPRYEYPEFISVEEHVRRAQAQRTVYIAHLIGLAAERIARGLKRVAIAFGDGLAAERDRRAIEADAFLKRAVPHR